MRPHFNCKQGPGPARGKAPRERLQFRRRAEEGDGRVLGLVRRVRLEPWAIQAPVSAPVLPGLQRGGTWRRLKGALGGGGQYWRRLPPPAPGLLWGPLKAPSSLLERVANLRDPQSVGSHAHSSVH